LGKQRVILGFSWLKQHNLIIDWETKEVTWRTGIARPKQHLIIKRYHHKKKASPKPTITSEPDREEYLNQTQNPTINDEILLAYLEEVQKPNEIWINTKTTSAIEFHLKHDEKKEELPLSQQIPTTYHNYLDVFDEDKADRFLISRPWDHKIELKEGFEPKSFKTYSLTPEEQKELDIWIKENLDKGYIRPSQSSIVSLFFYVKKKDRKLRLCQDHWYLNEWTIKNTYPLPLISELTDKLSGAKHFTKLNVRWGYNNI
jgi:hypothetical protein